jgi:hypothetical protein
MTAASEKRFLPNAGAAPSVTHFAETFPKIPALVFDYKSCGKAGCCCQRGELHGPYVYLRWREGRRQRRRYVPVAEVDAVQTIIARRRWDRVIERDAFADDLALWRRLTALRRRLDAELAARWGES